jgi:undecaprenyl-diphosphatase
MNLVEAIILGLIQGLTEFIPISSSGHLVITQKVFGHESDHLFLEVINIGTFVALVIYFFPKIINIIQDVCVNRNILLARNIIITSVPASIVGYIFADFIAVSPFFSSLWTVVVTLLLVGVIMVVLERLPKLSTKKSGKDLSAARALSIGVAQMAALIPGTSRSGSTIIAGRLMGLSAKDAAEYSFLASLPIMAGVTLKVILDNGSYLVQNAEVLLVANIAACLSGLVAVKVLIQYLTKHGLALFGWYRIALSAVLATILLV